MNFVVLLASALLSDTSPQGIAAAGTVQHRSALHQLDVGRGGVMRSDGRVLNKKALVQFLHHRPVYLQKDKDASYADMVKALKSLPKSSFYRVSLITDDAKAPR